MTRTVPRMAATLSLLAAAVSPAPAAPLFRSAVYRSGRGTTLPYRCFEPDPAKTGAAKRPLILFLHGEEAAGIDNRAQLTSSEGATIWVEPDHQAKNPTYVLAPQAPRGADWSSDPVYGDTLGLLKQFVAKHPDVDPDRLYLVGFSAGGTGAWTMLLRNPGLFAAAMPIAGNADAFLADKAAFAAARNTPVLPVHSWDDPVSPVRGAQNAIAALTSAGDTSVAGIAQIWGMGSVVPAHEAWRPAFHHYEVIYNWLFDQSLARTQRGAVAPSSLYTVRDLGGGVQQVWDYYLGTIYVIERADKALLIDTGMGTGSLYDFVRQRVLRNRDLPIEVAITHDHFDHISGLSGFVGAAQLRKVYVHEEDAAAVARVLKADAGKIQHLADGDRIPLGGGAVEVIGVPGHTFGSLVYLYERNLYTGDAVGTGDAWLAFSPMSVEDYVGSLQHLLDRIGGRSLAVLGGHTGECRTPLAVEYVRQLLACAKGLVDGTIASTPYRRTVGGQATLGFSATVGRATLVHDLNNIRATKGALRSLSVGTARLDPMFRPFRFFYSAVVGPEVAKGTITAVALARETATVTVNGAPVRTGAAYEASLQPGRNVFTIVVKTEDGGAGSYELTVDRGGSPPSRW
ncbi:MAG TPA: MBL fold metallo-hydrolase [Vicinamibacteria bacterium]|nr:MBL fold metallo-hydrolase [Vicinamibacteria bacterium]